MKKINHKVTHRFRLSALLLACLVLMAVFNTMPISAYAETTIPDATSQFYVNDFADIFTAEEESRLMTTAVALAEEHDGIQVVVTTIESLGGDTIENYAQNMYNTYGIGNNDIGLLILLSTGDREIWVQTGLGMEGYLPDSKVGRFIDDYAIPSLAENRFNEGLINLQEAYVKEIISCVEKEASAATPTQQPVATTTKSHKSSFNFGAVFMFIAISLLGTLIVYVAIKVSKIPMKRMHDVEVASLTEQLETERQNRANEKSRLSSEINSFRESLEALQKKYDTLYDRYNRAQTLHPEIDDEVSAMIADEIRQRDMAIAKDVEDTLRGVIHLNASRNIVSKLEYALSAYSHLSETQKSYVTSDISKVRALYNTSRKLQREYEEQQELERRKACAAAALTAITAIIAGISVGKARHLSSLRRAKSIYDNLDSGSRSYFDCDTAEKLDNLLAQAKRDKRREDEEEERREAARRRNSTSSYRSTSSFHSTSSHRGFGGRSGGGGAGRKF